MNFLDSHSLLGPVLINHRNISRRLVAHFTESRISHHERIEWSKLHLEADTKWQFTNYNAKPGVKNFKLRLVSKTDSFIAVDDVSVQEVL